MTKFWGKIVNAKKIRLQWRHNIRVIYKPTNISSEIRNLSVIMRGPKHQQEYTEDITTA
jgi:hypothetical protein